MAGVFRLRAGFLPIAAERPRKTEKTMFNIRRSIRISAIAVGALIFAAACGGGSDGGGGSTPAPAITEPPIAAFPFEIQRSDGKTLTIEKPVERVVSLSPGATEILYAIGAEAALIAVDNQADYPDAAKNFATKVDAFEPSVEAIAALEPGLVIVASDLGGIVDALDGLNIPVLFIDINTDVTRVEQVLGQISIYGRITGTSEAAARLIATLSARVQTIRDRARQAADGREAVKVYHELDSTFFSAADQSFIGDLYTILRADNIAGDGGGSPYPQLTQESIIAANPDVIILADEEFGVTVDSVKVRPGWGAIAAVSNGRIHGIDPDIISRPGPRIVDALEELAELLYPEGA
jgi:iron complex transport system substrate-binding protein